MEAAATLFGSDNAADPFSSLGQSDSDEQRQTVSGTAKGHAASNAAAAGATTTHSGYTSTDLFADPTSSTSDPFASISPIDATAPHDDAAVPFPDDPSQSYEQLQSDVSQAYAKYGSVNSSAYAPSNSTSAYSTTARAVSTPAEPGKGGYGASAYAPSAGARPYATLNGHSYTLASTQSSYTPSSYAVPASHAHKTTAPPTNHTYEQASMGRSSRPNAYDPPIRSFTPSQGTHPIAGASAYAYSTYDASASSYGQPVNPAHSSAVNAPPPPEGPSARAPQSRAASAASVTRPKVANAYDPPLFPMSVKRASSQAYATSHAYPAGHAYPESPTHPIHPVYGAGANPTPPLPPSGPGIPRSASQGRPPAPRAAASPPPPVPPIPAIYSPTKSAFPSSSTGHPPTPSASYTSMTATAASPYAPSTTSSSYAPLSSTTSRPPPPTSAYVSPSIDHSSTFNLASPPTSIHALPPSASVAYAPPTAPPSGFSPPPRRPPSMSQSIPPPSRRPTSAFYAPHKAAAPPVLRPATMVQQQPTGSPQYEARVRDSARDIDGLPPESDGMKSGYFDQRRPPPNGDAASMNGANGTAIWTMSHPPIDSEAQPHHGEAPMLQTADAATLDSENQQMPPGEDAVLESVQSASESGAPASDVVESSGVDVSAELGEDDPECGARLASNDETGVPRPGIDKTASGASSGGVEATSANDLEEPTHSPAAAHDAEDIEGGELGSVSNAPSSHEPSAHSNGIASLPHTIPARPPSSGIVPHHASTVSVGNRTQSPLARYQASYEPLQYSTPDNANDLYAPPSKVPLPESAPKTDAGLYDLSTTNPYDPPVINPYAPLSHNVYAPPRDVHSLPPSTSMPMAQPVRAPPADPYAPPIRDRCQSSASSQSSHSRTQSPVNHYAPAAAALSRTLSNGRIASSVAAGPYAPLSRSLSQGESDYGRPAASAYGYPSQGGVHQGTPHGHKSELSQSSSFGALPPSLELPPLHEVTTHELPSFQQQQLPTLAPYAPSPSLRGANDPLSRTSSRAPVFSFGFGGRFVSCFHATSLNTGFDVALASRILTDIKIGKVKDVLPASALDVIGVVERDYSEDWDQEKEKGKGKNKGRKTQEESDRYPGPLMGDPGFAAASLVQTTTSLVRGSSSAQKKGKLLKYLEDRVAELTRAVGYIQAGTIEKVKGESKLILVKILKAMVENDGRLTGSPQAEQAVRRALVPHSTVSAGDGLDFTMPHDATLLYSSMSNPDAERPISVTALRPSSLKKIQDLLLQGDRRQAYRLALDERLWAHAMVIASSIDKESWQEAVNEFVRGELGVQRIDGAQSQPLVNGREGLRAAYRLYSGQGSASVQELIPPSILAKTAAVSPPSGQSVVLGQSSLVPQPPVPLGVGLGQTPITPNFSAPTVAVNVPVESLANWAETAALMYSPNPTPETLAALTTLGDQLLSNQWVDAAHVCYLLSSQTSLFGGVGHPTARIVLLGSPSPRICLTFSKDPDPIMFSEIAEFALSLNSPAKGQEPFKGLLHLQAYKFVRAMALMELGEIQLASRYCEAISSLLQPSPYVPATLVEQLGEFSQRVSASAADKSGKWMSSKIGKPSLDTIGGWLENGFTKLVTGADGDSPSQVQQTKQGHHPAGFSGVFSQYSTISSTTTSSSPSPQPTGLGLSSSPYMSNNINPSVGRASLSQDNNRLAVPPPASLTSPFGLNSSSFSQNTYSPSNSQSSWWGSSTYDDAKTPTGKSFVDVSQEAALESTDGFISLMDNAPSPYMAAAATNHQPQQPSQPLPEEDEEGDWGFGNPKKKEKLEEDGDNAEPSSLSAAPAESKPAQVEAPKKPELKTQSTGSWLSKFWKKSDTPAPIKANLGEETSFYYDKELKRWVNKKAGGEEAKPAPPPPPPRARTTSPGNSGPRAPGMAPAQGPPRAGSAVDFNGARGAGALGNTRPHGRSNLAPTPETETAPPSSAGPPTSSPPSASMPPPPSSASARLGATSSAMSLSSNAMVPPPSSPHKGMSSAPPGNGDPPMPSSGSRPRSQASRRPARSRYVDVFNQLQQDARAA